MHDDPPGRGLRPLIGPLRARAHPDREQRQPVAYQQAEDGQRVAEWEPERLTEERVTKLKRILCCNIRNFRARHKRLYQESEPRRVTVYA